MKLPEQTQKMVDDFIKYFGEDKLPSEKEILEKIKTLDKLPNSIEDVYIEIFLEKLKDQLQKKYPLKTFVIKDNKISEVIDIHITTIRIVINDIDEYIGKIESQYYTADNIINIICSYMEKAGIDIALLDMKKLKEEISREI